MSPDKKKIEKIYSQIDKLATKGKEYIYEYYKLVDDLISKGEYNYYEMTLFYKYNISIIDNNNIKETRAKTWNEILFQTNSSVSKKIKKILDSKSVYQMGFDIYSDILNNLTISIGSPLSTTYSATTSTQVLSLNRVNNNIYLSTNDNNVYNVDIYYSQWNNNTPIATSVSLLQSISPTQSSATYSTEIPTTQGGSYLIRTHMRNPNPLLNYELNYKVNIEKSQLLGSIVEVDQFSVDSKYYLENKQFAKLMGTRVTYLEATYVGATASVIVNATNTSLSEDNNLVNRYKLAVEYLLSNS
jgi:hypothetical protein